MTFVDNQVIPDPDQAVLIDSQGQFDSDTPFNVKQAAVTMRRHRWYQPVDIGVASGPYTSVAGLPAGQQQRIAFDNRPDYVIVAVSGDTATTGRLSIFRGEPGGPPIRLGPGGRVALPGPEDGVITLVSRGTTSVFGTVIAVAGWQVILDLNPGL